MPDLRKKNLWNSTISTIWRPFVASVKAARLPPPPNNSGWPAPPSGKRIARLSAAERAPVATQYAQPCAHRRAAVLRTLHPRVGGIGQSRAMSCPAQHRAARPSENQRAAGVGQNHLLPPLLADFLHRYPQTSVELSLTDDYADLISDGYDLALRNGNPPQCDSLLPSNRRQPANAHLRCPRLPRSTRHAANTRRFGAPPRYLHFLHGGRVSQLAFS